MKGLIMKKLMLMISAIAAGFTASAQAEVSMSGKGELGAVSGSNEAHIYNGGKLSFAFSAAPSDTLTVSSSAGIDLDPNDDDDTAVTATGFSNLTFASGGATIVIGSAVGLAGEGAGSVGGANGDLVDEGGYARGTSAGLSDDEGYGVSLSTAFGSASVTASYFWDSDAEGNNADTSNAATASGISVSAPLGSNMTLGFGYASLDDSDETETGGSLAYTMGAGTLTVGMQSVKTASGTDDEESTSAKFSTTLGTGSLTVGYNNAKVGALKSTQTEINYSQPIGDGMSFYADLQSIDASTAGTSGTNIAFGTAVSF